MERRDFLKLTLGFVAGGGAMLAASAQAAPVPPISPQAAPVRAGASAEPAVVSQDDVDHIKPEQVRWHHHGHWHHRGHWHRHWHRRWHRRHWGWHHRRWHRHHWRHHRHW